MDNKKWSLDDKPPYKVFGGRSVKEALIEDFDAVQDSIQEHYMHYDSDVLLTVWEALSEVYRDEIEHLKKKIKMMNKLVAKGQW